MGFYGEPNLQKRHEGWARLCSLKNRSNAPWLCASDIDEITQQSKKCGGRVRPHNQMQPFKDVLDQCGFLDLGFLGFQFTWHKHYTNYTIWVRLDKVVATNKWLSNFPRTKIHHLDVTCFDHKPLWIVPDGMECSFRKPFRFEQMWISDKGCSDTIKAVGKERIFEMSATQVIWKVDRCREELA